VTNVCFIAAVLDVLAKTASTISRLTLAFLVVLMFDGVVSAA